MVTFEGFIKNTNKNNISHGKENRSNITDSIKKIV